jgi:hypothetical protein
MYRSVVWMEAWPSRNRICSSSPLQSWQRRAQVRLRSWGARLGMPACRAHRLTAYQTTFAVTLASCRFPTFETLLNTRPSLTPECESHLSSNCFDHAGTGTVRSRLPLPIKSTMTQRAPPAVAIAPASIRPLQNAVTHNREVTQRSLRPASRAGLSSTQHSQVLAPGSGRASCRFSAPTALPLEPAGFQSPVLASASRFPRTRPPISESLKDAN